MKVFNATISATSTLAHLVLIDEKGSFWNLLGPGPAYGLESTYAVQRSGCIQSPIQPADERGWPYPQGDVTIREGA